MKKLILLLSLLLSVAANVFAVEAEIGGPCDANKDGKVDVGDITTIISRMAGD